MSWNAHPVQRYLSQDIMILHWCKCTWQTHFAHLRNMSFSRVASLCQVWHSTFPNWTFHSAISIMRMRTQLAHLSCIPQEMYRPYAYDITEGRPRVLGVKRGTVTCAIAKHAASGPTPACHTAGPARARALTERLRAPTLFQHNTCAQRDKSWPPTWRRCYGDVTSMHKVYCGVQVSCAHSILM